EEVHTREPLPRRRDLLNDSRPEITGDRLTDAHLGSRIGETCPMPVEDARIRPSSTNHESAANSDHELMSSVGSTKRRSNAFHSHTFIVRLRPSARLRWKRSVWPPRRGLWCGTRHR